MIRAYFAADQQAIADADTTLAETETRLAELLDAVEMDGDEADDEDTETERSASEVKRYLKEQLKGIAREQPEAQTLLSQLAVIVAAEEVIRDGKVQVKVMQRLLAKKLDWKRYGIDDDLAELIPLLADARQSLLAFDTEHRAKAGNVFADGPAAYADKKTQTAYVKARQRQEAVIGRIEADLQTLHDELARMNGIITPDEARELILQKHNELVTTELTRYLLAGKRKLLATLENLWDKYAVSTADLEVKRADTLAQLNKFLVELNYL